MPKLNLGLQDKQENENDAQSEPENDLLPNFLQLKNRVASHRKSHEDTMFEREEPPRNAEKPKPIMK